MYKQYTFETPIDYVLETIKKNTKYSYINEYDGDGYRDVTIDKNKVQHDFLPSTIFEHLIQGE